MRRYMFLIHLVVVFLLATPVLYGEPCEDSGACTLSNGECGAECNGACLPFDEARCCLSGGCYRDGSWCGGVECNGACMDPEEARCCMSGCDYVNGECKCETK
jgi:hypothetical protein